MPEIAGIAADGPKGDALRVVATIGLHGSASTWVFNVVRELMAAMFGDALASGYADDMRGLPVTEGRRALALKSHHGSDELDVWLGANQARTVLSLRDPRDAAISMAQRFEAPLQHTARWLANDCQRMARLLAAPHLMLRYEDRFFDEPGTVTRVADWLELDIAADRAGGIFQRYRTAAVRSFAASLDQLPPERVGKVGKFRQDHVTQILSPHIGDGKVGKWRDLPPQAQAEITRFFGPFLDRFGYPR